MTEVAVASHPIRFLAWTLVLSIPFHVWSVLWPVEGLPFRLPISVVMIIIPAAVATILTFQEAGARRAVALWLRLADVRRIRGAGWLALALLTMPLASLLAYGLMGVSGLPLPKTLWRTRPPWSPFSLSAPSSKKSAGPAMRPIRCSAATG